MNTAKSVRVVEVHSSKLVIVKDPLKGFVSCCNAKQLWEAVHGIYRDESPATQKRFETTEEYLARGGIINKVTFPKWEPPVQPPAKPKVDAAAITLESLGL